MIELLMLGIVPGTNIQIDFTDWLIGALALSALVFLRIAAKRRVLSSLIAVLKPARLVPEQTDGLVISAE